MQSGRGAALGGGKNKARGRDGRMIRRFEDILDRVRQYNPEADFDLLRKAYVISAREHRDQVRRSGEPYLVHPLEVAWMLADLHLDTSSIVAGLLHDVVEDTLTTSDKVAEAFGEDVAHIVEGVTKISKLKYATQQEAQAENLRKMILAMVDDIRVILVKLADRRAQHAHAGAPASRRSASGSLKRDPGYLHRRSRTAWASAGFKDGAGRPGLFATWSPRRLRRADARELTVASPGLRSSSFGEIQGRSQRPP